MYKRQTYIREQIDSILKNIGLGDELVVSDDGSLDTTREILKSYQEQDARIRVMEGPGEGVIANVEAGLRACRGDYIFLADQDDVDVYKRQVQDKVYTRDIYDRD